MIERFSEGKVGKFILSLVQNYLRYFQQGQQQKRSKIRPKF